MEFIDVDSTPSNRVLPATKGKTSRTKRVWKQYYCGYVLDSTWYTEQAQARFGSLDGESRMSHRTRFLFGLLADAGLSRRALFRNVKFDGDSALCIALASNRSESEMKLPAQEKVDKLKALIGTDEPPKWYEYDG
jgi:hypothetical protein